MYIRIDPSMNLTWHNRNQTGFTTESTGEVKILCFGFLCFSSVLSVYSVVRIF